MTDIEKERRQRAVIQRDHRHDVRADQNKEPARRMFCHADCEVQTKVADGPDLVSQVVTNLLVACWSQSFAPFREGPSLAGRPSLPGEGVPVSGNRQKEGEADGGRENKSKGGKIRFRQWGASLSLFTEDIEMNICDADGGWYLWSSAATIAFYHYAWVDPNIS